MLACAGTRATCICNLWRLRHVQWALNRPFKGWRLPLRIACLAASLSQLQVCVSHWGNDGSPCFEEVYCIGAGGNNLAHHELGVNITALVEQPVPGSLSWPSSSLARQKVSPFRQKTSEAERLKKSFRQNGRRYTSMRMLISSCAQHLTFQFKCR